MQTERDVLATPLAVCAEVQLECERTRNASGSTQYSGVAHTDTEDEVNEFSPSNASPIVTEASPLQLAPSEAEEDWRAHVSEVMRGTAPEHAYCTFRLFARLFADASVRLAVLTSDSCALLQTPEIIQQVSNKLGTLPLPISPTPFRPIHTIH